ncbi:MAG: hypothetical protein KatS3mg110_2395 [Pirellulaceae bacterium]|nr:MAG: hypothetical protein KatS3mg110_2395 [Pirellulaceae bacterium]
MRTNLLRALYFLFAAVLGMVVAGGTSHAQQIRFASESIWQSASGSEQTTPVRLIDYACDSGSGQVCDDGCSRAGWVGSSELLFLKPFQSEGNFSDFNYRTGYRGTIGLQRYDGLGFRVRFFDYFQRAPGDERVDISSLDGEVYDSLVDNETWFISVGAGIRYLDFFVGDSPDPADGDSLTGVGPVITAELQRHLTDRLSLYAITRGAIIVGNSNDFGNANPDETGSMYEIQLGGQWSRPWRGALLFGRIGWEAQFYNAMDDSDSESLSLMGAVLAGGIQR